MIKEAYMDLTKTALTNVYLNEAMFQGPASFFFAYRFLELQQAIVTENTEKIGELKTAMALMGEEHFSMTNYDMDREIFAAMMEEYVKHVPESQQSPIVTEMLGKTGTITTVLPPMFMKDPFLQTWTGLGRFSKSRKRKPSARIRSSS